MEKTRFFIMIVFILTILTACTQNKEPAKGPEKAAASKSALELTPIKIAANAEIVFLIIKSCTTTLTSLTQRHLNKEIKRLTSTISTARQTNHYQALQISPYLQKASHLIKVTFICLSLEIMLRPF